MAITNTYIGSQFGNYEITSEIDRGSSGCVHQARHIFLNRIVALKILHTAHLHSQSASDKFFREAQILENLKHPHILFIYEYGIKDGIPYLITEYASGGSLRDLIRRRSPRPLLLKDAIAIISQVGEALDYAHQQGIIHCDIKPENILFNSAGDVLLADFGIAIVRAATTLEQQLTEVSGTPAYMAPEQFRGKISRRSDLYAVGCIAYELVTGRMPFIAINAVSMGLKHLQELPVPPNQINPDLPEEVGRVILKALEKRRINRYPDVSTFIQELEACSAAPAPASGRQKNSFLALSNKTKMQYLNEGHELYSAGLLQEALRAYEQAIRLDPQCTNAYFSKGNALYSPGLMHSNQERGTRLVE